MRTELDDTLADLSQRRIARFTAAMLPIAGAYLALFAALAFAWHSTALAGGALAVVVYIAALVRARQELAAGRPARAAVLTSSGLLAMIAIGAPFLHFQLGALLVITIAAVTVVLPHLDRAMLLRFQVAAVAVALEVVLVDGFLPPFTTQPPRWFQLVVLISSVMAACILTMIMMASDQTRMRALLEATQAHAASARLAREATDAFLVAAAHQLRTPISSVLMQTETLAATTAQDGAAERFARILRQAHRLERVVDVMLDVSRLTADTLVLERAPFDVTRLVRDVAEEHASAASAAGSALELELPATCELVGDAARLGTILASLLDNAIKYGGGAPITIQLTRDAVSVALTVEDGGRGVLGEQRIRVFERDVRLSPRPDGGFGIGLWLVRELARRMGGDATVEDAPGGGARFTVRLPRI